MRGTEVLADAFGRIPALVRGAIEGATPEQLTARLDPDANTLAWLAWHIGREQDAQLADLCDRPQVWVAGNWAARLGLDVPVNDVGYGNTSAQVAEITAPGPELIAYVEAVERFAQDALRGWSDDDLDAVIDENWTPPVTRGARLVSIVGDALEHAGQAAFLRGVLDRQR